MKFKILIVLLSFYAFSNAQSVESIAVKISEQMCKCISENKQITSLTVANNHCEQETLNNLDPLLSSKEIDFVQTGSNLTNIRRRLFLLVNENCTYLRETLNPNLKIEKREEFPISLTSDSYDQINSMEGELISVQGTVKKIKTVNGLPYFLIESDGHVLFVSGAFKSGFEIEGNHVKILGYVKPIQKNKAFKKMQKGHTQQINAYGVVNTADHDFAYFPGFENKMSVWREGRLPK